MCPVVNFFPRLAHDEITKVLNQRLDYKGCTTRPSFGMERRRIRELCRHTLEECITCVASSVISSEGKSRGGGGRDRWCGGSAIDGNSRTGSAGKKRVQPDSLRLAQQQQWMALAQIHVKTKHVHCLCICSRGKPLGEHGESFLEIYLGSIVYISYHFLFSTDKKRVDVDGLRQT